MQSDATTSSFHGFVKDHYDALLLITAARLGFIPRFRRRLNMTEQRALICSGSVFLWTEEESFMKRWTDGYPWSPSRVHHDFLLYREMVERGCARSRTSSRLAQNDTGDDGLRPYDDRRRNMIRVLAGSLFNNRELDHLVHSSTSGSVRSDDVFKRGGLMKKTFSLSLPGETWHLVSYYTLEDVLASRLQTPRESSFFEGVGIPEDVRDFHALTTRRQPLESCMRPFVESSPTPPLVSDSPSQPPQTFRSPVPIDLPEAMFSSNEWCDVSSLAATEGNFTPYTLTPSAPTCAPVHPNEGPYHFTIENSMTGWYAFT